MSAHGADPRTHHVIVTDGVPRFVCSAPADASCRTYPTCDCETWCCCPTVGEYHDTPKEHCCTATNESGRPCWLDGWMDAVGLEDMTDESLREGRWSVDIEWDDGCWWEYADPAPEAALLERDPIRDVHGTPGPNDEPLL